MLDDVDAALLPPQGPEVDSVALGNGEGTAELPPHALVESSGSIAVTWVSVRWGVGEVVRAAKGGGWCHDAASCPARIWSHLGGGRGATGGRRHGRHEVPNADVSCMLLAQNTLARRKRLHASGGLHV